MFESKSLRIVIFSVLSVLLFSLGAIFFVSKRKQNIKLSTLEEQLLIESDKYANATLTIEAFASNTPYPTYTPEPTYTAYPTYTPVPPTSTPTIPPTATLTPTPQFETKTLGPIWDWDTKYSVEMSITEIRWSDGGSYDSPKVGYEYLILFIDFKNTGPMEIQDLSDSYFKVLNKNGVLKEPYYGFTPELDQCELGYIDQLMDGGEIEFCLVFEVPEEGVLEFIYTPERYDKLREGKYISYIIRE